MVAMGFQFETTSRQISVQMIRITLRAITNTGPFFILKILFYFFLTNTIIKRKSQMILIARLSVKRIIYMKFIKNII